MKKKTTKKLVLAKETVRNLEVAKLGKVAGGMQTCGSCGARFCVEQPMEPDSAPCTTSCTG